MKINHPPNLTFVTAVLNESSNLSILGKHLRPFIKAGAEWIVIIDYRTTDDSLKKAESHGARVVLDSGESKGIVFNNKNLGIFHAKNKWIMIIDSDEKMDKILQKEIIQITTSDKANYVYETGFINYEFGQWFTKSEMKNKTFVRLFPKGCFSYNTSLTAEGGQIQKSLLPVIKMKGKLWHNSHPTIQIFLHKINRYSDRESLIQAKKTSLFKIFFMLLIDPLREFIWKYCIWKLYKEGWRGFVVSMIFAYYHFQIWLKSLYLKFKLRK